ncbi:PREDICTED: protein very KIND, partial [Bison bison bison]|uniref:Protein very KIND n=1 Tax=Bison bison bison TaxID=43346 RepID=A0A6P3HXX4_BISBB
MDRAAAAFYEEDGKDLDFYDFEPLPTLPEDEENVSLADILSLRDSGLSEQEAWAVCLECSLAMRSVAHSAIFQTLCITPDTLAFNTSGNVCFMEQLSDDPEGAFVPPEFDVTGNTFEAHIYSLGATLKAALDYVPEPDPQPRLSQELEALLGQMQAEDPGDRPDLQSIIALCEEKMQLTSSCRLCRSLSAAGRRVLSIESFGAFQDVSDITWRGRLAPRGAGPKRQLGDHSADPEALPAPEGWPPSPTREGPEHPGTPPSKALLSSPVKNGESPGQEGLAPKRLACLLLDAQRPPADQDRGFLDKSRLRKVRTLPRLPPDGPESGALCLSLTSVKTPLPTSEFFPPDTKKAFPEGKHGLSSFQAQPGSRLWLERELELRRRGDKRVGGVSPARESPPPGSEGPRDVGGDPGTLEPDEGTADGAGEPDRAAAEQGVSLQDLLTKLGRPFKEYELWALSHACLSTLRTLGQHPAWGRAAVSTVWLDLMTAVGDEYDKIEPRTHYKTDLCGHREDVLCSGSLLSAFSSTVGFRGALGLGPPQGHLPLVESKLEVLSPRPAPLPTQASVYCVAAVLWTAAKFSVPRDRKLALPRRLKTLLLHMARRSAQERPSAAEAIETCSGYLLQRGMDSRKILAHLRALTCRVYQEEETIGLQRAFSVLELEPSLAAAPRPNSDLVRIAGDSRLAAVQGPVPSQPSGLRGAMLLPEALTSPDTHCRPVVLTADADVSRDRPALTSGPAESPEATGGQLDPQGDGKQAVTAPSPETAMQPAPSPPGPLRESGPSLATGNPDSPGAAPGGQPEAPQPADRKLCPSSVDAPPLPEGVACPALQEATRLIQEEFASDGYLDRGLEALIMGEYIYALKDLTYATFCGAISEKFCDLYWGEKLLQSLFNVVNGRTPPSGNASEDTGSQPEGSRTRAPSSCSPSSRRASRLGPALEARQCGRAHAQDGRRTARMLGHRAPVEVPKNSPMFAGTPGSQRGPAVSPAPLGATSCSPGWCSAFYEADCFGADVHSYVQELAEQKAPGDPAANTQSPELEQQLMIEKRNFRKTLKFYQKLLQKEKRNKGSEVKTMLSKLKGQLEEMRSKVQFLGLAKKYLQ